MQNLESNLTKCWSKWLPGAFCQNWNPVTWRVDKIYPPYLAHANLDFGAAVLRESGCYFGNLWPLVAILVNTTNHSGFLQVPRFKTQIATWGLSEKCEHKLMRKCDTCWKKGVSLKRMWQTKGDQKWETETRSKCDTSEGQHNVIVEIKVKCWAVAPNKAVHSSGCRSHSIKLIELLHWLLPANWL